MNKNEIDNRLLPVFRGWAIANFPFIEEDFDEMTIYGMICKISEYLNQMRIQVNKNTETAQEYEEYLVEIKAKVLELETEFEQFKNDVEEEINQRFTELTTLLINEIETELGILRYEMNQMYNELSHRIDEIVAGDITLYDPTTGLISPIQVVINNLFDMNRVNAITCTEYDGLELTATYYDSLDISAYDFDVNAKALLIGQ